MPAKADRSKIKQEYVAWCATPKRLRIQLNLPATKRSFAELKGISERTLQRWDNDADHAQLVDQHRRKFAGNVDNASLVKGINKPRPEKHGNALKKYEPEETVKLSDDPVWNPELSADEQRYVQVKDTLLQMASDGSQAAIDLYLKHWGKSFVEAEQSVIGMFPNMSDHELTERILKLLGKERISKFLTEETVNK